MSRPRVHVQTPWPEPREPKCRFDCAGCEGGERRTYDHCDGASCADSPCNCNCHGCCTRRGGPTAPIRAPDLNDAEARELDEYEADAERARTIGVTVGGAAPGDTCHAKAGCPAACIARVYVYPAALPLCAEHLAQLADEIADAEVR